jgi:hypothetical protein
VDAAGTDFAALVQHIGVPSLYMYYGLGDDESIPFN